jgi:hypothetical protein
MAKKGERTADRVQVTCPCGTEFEVTRRRFEEGRGRRCSKPCTYKYMERPSGLTYNIVQENAAWKKPGDEPWNKGMVMKDEITYKELHKWVARHREKTGVCEHCGETRKTEWANKSHTYQRDLADWLELCKKCHGKHDSGENRGKAVEKFGVKQVACR